METEHSEKGEVLAWIVLNFQLIVFVLMVLAQVALAMIYLLEGIGAPRWAAVGGMLLLPVISWFVVMRFNRRQEITSLTLNSQDPPDLQRRLARPSDRSRWR